MEDVSGVFQRVFNAWYESKTWKTYSDNYSMFLEICDLPDDEKSRQIDVLNWIENEIGWIHQNRHFGGKCQMEFTPEELERWEQEYELNINVYSFDNTVSTIDEALSKLESSDIEALCNPN